MKFGMNLLLWTGGLNDGMMPVCEMLKEIGYDGVEIPILDPTPLLENAGQWKQRLDDLGLRRTAVTVGTNETNVASPVASIRAAGRKHLKRVLDVCAAMDITTLCGPFHSALGVFRGQGPTPDELKWAAESLNEVAQYAEQLRTTDLALEALNRFECYLVNSMEQLITLVQAVDHSRLGGMYDSFHGNIEEKSVGAAIRIIAPELMHVHISENDRSTPGKGNVRWAETFDALRQINYDGWLTVEAFGLALPELAAATKIWRRMFESEEQLARDALYFMKREVQIRWAHASGMIK